MAGGNNAEIPKNLDEWDIGNYGGTDQLTQTNCIDMKWPNCYTGGKKEILDVFTTKSASSREGSLAETVGERWSKEERWFSGRPQQD